MHYLRAPILLALLVALVALPTLAKSQRDPHQRAAFMVPHIGLAKLMQKAGGRQWEKR